MKKKTSKLLPNLWSDTILRNKLVSLGDSNELPALFKGLGWRIIYAAFPSKAKIPSRMHQLNMIAGYLRVMQKHHGDNMVVAYLKASQLAVQKAIAGQKISSLREINPDYPFPYVSRSGLPRIIPLRDRRAIMAGRSSVIRWWLTIFSVYRVLSVPGKLKLSTITGEFSGKTVELGRVGSHLRVFTLMMKSKFPGLQRPAILRLESASPTSRSSWTGIVRDVWHLCEASLERPLMTLLEAMGAKDLISLFKTCKDLNAHDPSLRVPQKGFEWDGRTPLTGQLSLKEEAAGKVRVFALVDLWTQSVLHPLHQALFSFLRELPNDGTFDQHASVKRAKSKSEIAGCSFGYDLSAATDRLPIYLQEVIIGSLYGESVSAAWRDLLVGRDYVLRSEKYGHETVRYSVGQPMGAYSSWAMLAITHHFIVQYAATLAQRKSLGEWYDNYELLGDDIILFDEKVASQYLSIMEDIGVPINLSKSVVAKNATIEFAKVTFSKGQNVSAISWKMFMSQRTNMGRANIAFSLWRKDIATSHIVSWIHNIIRHRRRKEGDIKYPLFALLTMAVNSKFVKLESLLKTAIPKRGFGHMGPTYAHLLNTLSRGKMDGLLARIHSGKLEQDHLHKDYSWMMYESSFKQMLEIKVKAFVDKFDFNKSAIQLSQRQMEYLAPFVARKAWEQLFLIFGSDQTERWNKVYNYLYKENRSVLLDSYDKIKNLIYMNLPATEIGSPWKGALRERLRNSFLSGNDYEAPPRPSDYTMLTAGMSLSESVSAINDIDRLKQSLDLVSRAKAKAEGAPPKEVIESPLAGLNLLRSAIVRSQRLTPQGAPLRSRRQRRSRQR